MEVVCSLSKPIFIVACPRSGTTILASFLNSHSQIASSIETHFFNFVSKQYQWGNFDQAQFDLLLKESRIVDLLNQAKLPKSNLNEAFTELKIKNKKNIFDLLMQGFLKSKNKIRLCEKTPQHLWYVDEILDLYPDAKIIYMIRDGRNTVSSLMKMPWRPRGLIRNAKFWQRYVNFGTKLKERYKNQTQNFYQIKFEELLTQPQESLQRLTSFLELDFELSMIKGSENIFSNWEATWKYKASMEIDTGRIEAWRKDLNEQEQNIINWKLGAKLRQLSYLAQNNQLNLDDYLFIASEYFDLYTKKSIQIFTDLIN